MQTQQLKYSDSEAGQLRLSSSDWLRRGEKRALLPPAGRSLNSHRYYTSSDLELLRSVSIGQRPRKLKRVEEEVGG